jgi:hypothetical protein
MIFRDINTGNLLNIRRNDYTNDRLFYSSVMKSAKKNDTIYKTTSTSTGTTNGNSTGNSTSINHDKLASSNDYIPSWVNSIISLSHNNNA